MEIDPTIPPLPLKDVVRLVPAFMYLIQAFPNLSRRPFQ